MWLKILYLTTHEQTLMADEIRRQLKHIITPHMISNTMMLKFCKLELAWPSYDNFVKSVQVFMRCFFVLSFYIEGFSMHHHVGFLQIR